MGANTDKTDRLTMSEQRRLKILFLPIWYPDEDNPVAGIFVKEHAKAVALYNDIVVLYSRKVGKGVKGLYEIISDEKEAGIRTIRVNYNRSPIPKTSDFIYLWSMFAAFKKLLKQGWRPDIIHAHVYSAGADAVIIGKRYNIPVVISEHWSGFLRRSLKKIDILKARFAMNRASIILPVSNHLQEAIKSYGIRNKFTVVPNVVNTTTFRPPACPKNGGKKNILFVGLIVPIKGIGFLLRALAQVKEKRQDFVVDIVGDGPNRKEYEKLTEESGLGHLVKFHGFKIKEEVAEFMKNCDFLVQPSLYETFGVTYIEAMACGKPVVATQLRALQEKINKDRGILVPPKDANALADAIDYMLDHHKDYSPQKIRGYVKDEFSYDVVGKKLNEIYREILQEHPTDRSTDNSKL